MGMVLVIGASAVWAAPNAVTLEFKGEPGQEARYSTTFSMSMDLDVQNPETGEQVLSLAPRMGGSAVTVSRVAEVSENGDLTLAGRIESFDLDRLRADGDTSRSHRRRADAGSAVGW